MHLKVYLKDQRGSIILVYSEILILSVEKKQLEINNLDQNWTIRNNFFLWCPDNCSHFNRSNK